MKKTYLSPRTRFIDLSMEVGCLGDMSMPVVRDDDEGVDYDGVLTQRDGSIWNNWSENDK